MVIMAGAHAQQWEVFDESNSPLPVNTVNALAEDNDGRIWIGTDWGLAVYDAGDWTVHQTHNSPLPENTITAIAVSQDGRVWVGTVSGGMMIIDGGEWTLFNTSNSGLPADFIRHIHIDQSGRAWVSTELGLACYNGTDWHVYSDTPASHNGLVLNSGNIRVCAVRADGLVAIGTFNGGFHYLTDTSVHYLTSFEDGFFDNTATGIIIDPSTGDRWVATPAAGLLRHAAEFQHGLWVQFAPFTSSIPTSGLSCLAGDQQGRIWIGTFGMGLVMMENGGFVTYNTANSGLPDNDLRCVFVTASGDIWAGTVFGGVGRMNTGVGVARDEGGRAGFRLWPVPTVDRLFIEPLDPDMHGQWRAMDQYGHVLASGILSGGREPIDVSDWPSGCYVVTVTSMNNFFSLRAIKA